MNFTWLKLTNFYLQFWFTSLNYLLFEVYIHFFRCFNIFEHSVSCINLEKKTADR